MNNLELEQIINEKLAVHEYQDYAPNGLQVEGRKTVKRIVTGVTACQALLDEAVRLNADTVLVHHGYFWKNEPVAIRGMKQRRIKTLLYNDINLYGYHLPLDGHPVLGNNAQLADLMGVTITGQLDQLLPCGEFSVPVTGEELAQRLQQGLGRDILHCGDNAPAQIKKLAWCTGGGQSFIQMAADAGVDGFVTGEVSEQTIHVAREMGLHFFAAGHHATERGGIRALGEWLKNEKGLDVIFVDIPNPA